VNDDADLVARSLAGDSEAYAILMRRYFAVAFATALQITAVAEDAEDACSEAFARAYFRLARCGYTDRFRGWLLQIVRRQALNVRRYQALRAAVSLDSVPEPVAESSTGGDVPRNDLPFQLRRALDLLPPIKRAVVKHHDVDGWTHNQVAELLGISVFMSRRHLSDAHVILRDQIGNLDREAMDDD
jgi:RNA polymerase sigma-70 factor (ECF subfamily)